jgi:acetyl-CoA/propionyl-CoA carboxylase, biotin carboxylase, biotin carboxyl carrier protein
MNTRLQVEHPVTEEVARVRGGRLDLVAEQLRVAAGEELGYDQGDVTLEGHAVEVRLYAEDPSRGFLPTGGRILDLVWPAQARVDAGVAAGTEVGSRYDPMLAKIITYGPDRASALARLDAALAGTTVLGVRTNLAWLRTLIADEDVRAGRLDTGLIARLPVPAEDLPDDVLAAAALAGVLDLPTGDDPFDRIGGWRLGADPAPARWRVVPAAGATGDPVDVAVVGTPEAATVTIGADGTPRGAAARSEGADLVLTLDGATRRFRTAMRDGVRWLGREGGVWALREQERLRAARTAAGAGQDGPLTAPMPGTVTAVEVAEGDHVTAGQRLVVVEAMKMEHVVSAPVDGVVKDLAAKAGAAVALDAPLVTVVPEAGE